MGAVAPSSTPFGDERTRLTRGRDGRTRAARHAIRCVPSHARTRRPMRWMRPDRTRRRLRPTSGGRASDSAMWRKGSVGLPDALVRVTAGAQIRGLSTRAAVPLELGDRVRGKPSRELLAGSVFERRHHPRSPSQEEQFERPSRQRSEQLGMPLEEPAEVGVEPRSVYSRSRSRTISRSRPCGKSSSRVKTSRGSPSRSRRSSVRSRASSKSRGSKSMETSGGFSIY